jgi:ubiquinone/menaquinone biosynthesis C-methylase UbiE
MKLMQQKYIQAQERKGIKFQQAVKFWKSKKKILDKSFKKIENKKMVYPAYFTDNIHTYENGHLNWEHAYQTKCHMQGSAMMSMKDITGKSHYTPDDAYYIYKQHIVRNITENMNIQNLETIVDFGCGTGETTQMLKDIYTDSNVIGLDLSPHYLSIATYNFENFNFVHANMESTDFETGSIDVVTICYAFHEMIPEAIKNTINETKRILKEGGVCIIVDMDPQRLPRFPSFIDISEPHLKKYRNVDIMKMLYRTGFKKCERKKLHCYSSIFVGTNFF